LNHRHIVGSIADAQASQIKHMSHSSDNISFELRRRPAAEHCAEDAAEFDKLLHLVRKNIFQIASGNDQDAIYQFIWFLVTAHFQELPQSVVAVILSEVR